MAKESNFLDDLTILGTYEHNYRITNITRIMNIPTEFQIIRSKK